ncbi:MAG: carboxypeptidase regulatory-like domain-containing protein [Planctomycetota bacterium JB042]
MAIGDARTVARRCALLLLTSALAWTALRIEPERPRSTEVVARPVATLPPAPAASTSLPPVSREPAPSIEADPSAPSPALASADRRATLEVRTLDDDGAAVAGVALRLAAEGRPSSRASTDATGAARFERLPGGAIEVSAVRGDERLACRVVRLRTDRPNDCVLTVRDAGPRLFGRVTDARGRPATDLVLTLVRLVPGRSSVADVSLAPGDDGTYRTPPLRPGRHLVTFRTGGSLREIDRRFVDLDRDDTRLDLILAPGATVAGAVRDAAGNPLLATVLLHRPATDVTPPIVRHARSDADTGAYAIDGVAPGPYRVVVEAIGRVTHRSDVDVPLGGRRDLDWSLVAGGVLRGRVLSDGAPVADAEVDFVRFHAGGADDVPGSVRTDAEGRFEASGLPFGRYRVRALPVEHAWATRDDVVLDPDTSPVETTVTVTSGASLAGTIACDPTSPPARRLVLRIDSDALGWRVLALPIDEEGRFRLDHVPAGRLDLEARLGDRRARRHGVRFHEEEETTWNVVFDP